MSGYIDDNLDKQLSAYHVNHSGVIAYSGLPTGAEDLAFEHHNGRARMSICILNSPTYEVYGASGHHLVHGKMAVGDGYAYVLLNDLFGGIYRRVPCK